MSRRTRAGRTGAAALLAAASASVLLAVPEAAWGGPPYLTDDPEPVEYRHWELYLASQWDHVGRDGASGSLPHVEANYGVVPGAMLHLLVPSALTVGAGRSAYGLGDVEVGANIRIVREEGGRPQIGTFPIAQIPTGSEARGLGAGTVQLFLPIWVMKHLGPWSLDAGGGVHWVGGDADVEAGALVQRTLGASAELGAEVFVSVPLDGSPLRTQIDLGLVVDLSETQHLLLSGGPSFGAEGGGQAYAAWLMTL